MKKNASNNLFVALGILESDPGFSAVSPSLQALGDTFSLGPCVWYIKSEQSAANAFRLISASMLDRRIDSSATLFIFDPFSGEAKWHVRQPLSDLILSHWKYRNNLFISISLKESNRYERALHDCITRLGMWAPLTRTLWYVSTTYTANDAFHFLVRTLESGDSLAVLDNQGNIATWRQGARDKKFMVREDRGALHSISGNEFPWTHSVLPSE